ncbi:MAG: NADH-quinone oxidoreductase subunit L, partial [Pseudomonadota bacterium]
LAIAGVAVAGYIYLVKPSIAESVANSLAPIYRLFDRKYYFDDFNEKVLSRGAVGLGNSLWKVGDQAIIDSGAVNGTAHAVGWLSRVARKAQTGLLYHYAFAMVIGLSALLGWLIFA